MSKEERIEDAHSIINLFLQQYGPLPWKEANLGINFSELSNKFIDAASSSQSDKEFYKEVINFLSSFKDAHVNYQLPSSLVAYLPFRTEYFKDGVVIREINRKLLSESTFPFNEGDLLIAIDDIPIEKVIDSLIIYEENGNEATNRKYVGSQYLTFRSQKKVVDIPSGPVKLSILPKGSGSPKEVMIEWVREGNEIAEIPPKSAISFMAKALLPEYDPIILNPISEFENSHYVTYALGDNGYTFMESAAPFFPMWDSFKQRMDSPFFIGTYTIGDKIIGFVRINTWYVDNFPQLVEILSREIQYLNNNTDALVIDQTNNGGGNICYPFWVGSMFITQPKKLTKFQLRANRSQLIRVESWYGASNSENKIHAKEWIASLRSAVEHGSYLSDPISAYCSFTGEIFPYRNKNDLLSVYIKPVLILVNELDFSAADSFPAFMQDWGAATIFGARTVGAGGNVVEAKLIGNSELFIRLTQSLAYRENEVVSPNGIPTHYIENVGVTPDVPYEITLKDYYDNYRPYREAIDKAILGLIENHK